MKIVIIYDAAADDWSDEDIAQVLASVKQVGAALRRKGHVVQLVPVRPDLSWLAPCRRADVVFNLCEGVGAVSRAECLVAGALQLVSVPFTGATPEVMITCLRKPMINALLDAHGVPVPRWTIPNGKRVPSGFPLPAIVKPAREDASVGIDQNAVVTTRRALGERVAKMSEQFDEVMVQQYVGGREFAVGFVGDQVLPVSEIDFSDMPDGAWPILSFDAKWTAGSAEDAGSQPVCPARIPRSLEERLVSLAREAWRTAGGSGYGRVDFRVDEQGQPWVLEVNPNPDISDEAGLSRMAAAFGWDYDALIMRIVEAALTDEQQFTVVAEELGNGVRSRRERQQKTA